MEIGVSYFGNRMLKHVEKDMRELVQNGFTFVLHTYSEFDLIFRKKTMKQIINLSKDAGLDVVVNPWGMGNVFGGEPFSDFVIKNYNDSCQELDNGETVGIACPNAPKFNLLIDEWIAAIADSGADYILWDEPHFHEQGFLSSIDGHWGCRCGYCKEKYYSKYQEVMPMVENLKVINFKKESLLEFIKNISEKASRRNIKNILYLTANVNVNKIKIEWEKYFKLNSIDVISSGPYWQWINKHVDIVEQYSQALSELSMKHKKNAQIWLQGFAIKKDKEEEISEAIKIIKEGGINNFAIWGYEGVAHESWIASENPDKVWSIILSSIKTITDN